MTFQLGWVAVGYSPQAAVVVPCLISFLMFGSLPPFINLSTMGWIMQSIPIIMALFARALMGILPPLAENERYS
jgi:hypothetical protein